MKLDYVIMSLIIAFILGILAGSLLVRKLIDIDLTYCSIAVEQAKSLNLI